MASSLDLVVVGAGIAGLSVALQAQEVGKSVAIVEISPDVGGLCGSFEYEGCILDFGVHLLHARDRSVFDFVSSVVGPKMVSVKRGGKLFLDGGYIDWPFSLRSPFQMRPRLLSRIVREQLGRSRSQVEIDEDDSYESAVQKLFGRELSEVFFVPMTQKFFKLEPSLVHSDWASSSMRSATKVEDKAFQESGKYHQTRTKSIDGISAWRTLVDSFRAKITGEDFYYFEDGYGTLANSLAKKFLSSGGRILSNSAVTSIRHDGKSVSSVIVTSNDEEEVSEFFVERLLWTGNLEALGKTLGAPRFEIGRINSAFVYLFLAEDRIRWQTCYFVGSETQFVRATFLSNHSKTIIRRADVRSVLCLEYTFRQGTSGEVDINQAVREAVEVGLVSEESVVVVSHRVVKNSSYPLFTLDYADALDTAHKNLPRLSNLYTFGRQGRFSYENADILISEALSHEALSGWR